MKGRDRVFEIHVQARVPVGSGHGLSRVDAIGIDHGLVHPMTTYDPAFREEPATRDRPGQRGGRARGSSNSGMTMRQLFP